MPAPDFVSALLPVRTAPTEPLWTSNAPLLLVIVPLFTFPPPVSAPSVLLMLLPPRSAVPPETVSEPAPNVPVLVRAKVPEVTTVPPV